MGFGDVLKKAFPFISAAASLGGPLGTMAANAVGAALGVSKVTATEEGIGSAIAAAQIKDPDALVKLQQAEQDFKLQMSKLGFEDAEKLAEIAAGDRANARARQIAVKDWIPGTMAISVTTGFFALLTVLCVRNVPASSHDILMTMVGVLGTSWVGIVTYYFGSSAGSAQKTQIIANQAGQQ